MGFEAEAFDESRDAGGTPRPGYDRLFAALDSVDLTELSQAVADELAEEGVSFGDQPFVIDPVPRLIPAADWIALAAGLAQRARALNAFLHDVYGEQRIVRAGLIAADVLYDAEGWEPDLPGFLPKRGAPAAVIGFDVVRDPDGKFLVLEDNARTPSGFAYALAARSALRETLPPDMPTPWPVDPVTYDLLRQALHAAAPKGVEDPSIIILTDGPANVAYSEHALAAAALGVPLVTLNQLSATRERRLQVRLEDGEVRDVDVLYRRCDEDRIRDEHGHITPVAGLILPPWLSGHLGLVNAFGNGVADDKLIHRHVEAFVRFYLEEEPLVRSVPTYEFGAGDGVDGGPERLRHQVVKPRHGHGGVGVVIGPHASMAELERLAEKIDAHPERYISQPPVALSRHPTVIDGRLEPRHVDLRAFAFFGREPKVMPGGLSRVATERGKLIVNSSQQGGGKDTWILG
jgi:uncharacterized circularly permuted ATP-grasp superfamily protein